MIERSSILESTTNQDKRFVKKGSRWRVMETSGTLPVDRATNHVLVRLGKHGQPMNRP